MSAVFGHAEFAPYMVQREGIRKRYAYINSLQENTLDSQMSSKFLSKPWKEGIPIQKKM